MRPDLPGYWMYEVSGVLRPAVEAYLNHETMTQEQIAVMRAYLRRWMLADWRGETVDELRRRVDGLFTRVAIKRWLDGAEAEGIDPL